MLRRAYSFLTAIYQAVRKLVVGKSLSPIVQEPELIVFGSYMDNLVLYLEGRSANEYFMRRFEELIEIPPQGADDFRRLVMTYMGTLACHGRAFFWDSHAQIARAVRLYVKEHPIGSC